MTKHEIYERLERPQRGAVWVTKTESEEETTGVFLVMDISSIPR